MVATLRRTSPQNLSMRYHMYFAITSFSSHLFPMDGKVSCKKTGAKGLRNFRISYFRLKLGSKFKKP